MSAMQDAIEALAKDVHEECGWLSGAQGAQLRYNESTQAVEFCGEGSIDLAHLVGIVERALAEWDPA